MPVQIAQWKEVEEDNACNIQLNLHDQHIRLAAENYKETSWTLQQFSTALYYVHAYIVHSG